jgi:RNA polymerase sigma-70 factor (ECF subfamily)
MQEVFLQLYRKLNSFRGEAAFGSWLYRVATNVIMMHLRKRHVETIPLQNLECASRSGIRDRQDPIESIALLRALCGLSKNGRTLVLLHDLKGLSHNEVAQSLGVSTSTSKSRLHQAHRQLRETLSVADMRHRSFPQNVDSELTNSDGLTSVPLRDKDDCFSHKDDCIKGLAM